MYNDNQNCVPVCDCEGKESRPALSELLGKLNDLSKENLNLVNSIKDNLYGATPEEGCAPTSPIGCMEDCIKDILANTSATNLILIQIRERL